jgi:tripartite-type tricarboxylate transporter receptor subunit TctC
VITALPHWTTGKLRVLGVSTEKRATPMPDVPTLSEAGLAGFDAHTSFGLFAVAGTPKEIVAKLVRESARAAKAPEVKERLASQGMEVVGSTDEDFAAYSKQEIAKWTKVFRERNIKLE